MKPPRARDIQKTSVFSVRQVKNTIEIAERESRLFKLLILLNISFLIIELTLGYIFLPSKNTPFLSPTISPTFTTTNQPSFVPTSSPTASPTNKPTISPTYSPTNQPSLYPTTFPTAFPTDFPTAHPTSSPTDVPRIGISLTEDQ
eukprot:snap_masked-scaffold_8-processed-gene-14.45-mRNA-1 protein AED:0.25 eAED:0.26 QI:0/-1/0/1/-1/1/1/0/144